MSNEVPPGFESGNYRMFAGLSHLKILESGPTIFCGSLIISTDFSLLPNYFLSPKIISIIGLIEYNKFGKYPFCCILDETYSKKENPIPISILLNQHLSILSTFIHSLWFIKDNSVNYYTAYGFSTEDNVVSLRRAYKMSNCKGLFSDVEFTYEEIKKAVLYLNKLIEIGMSEVVATDPFLTGNLSPSSAYFHNHRFKNRIERAIDFLVFARGSDTIPMQISFYVAVMECLFTTDQAGLSHKIAERCSLYIGGNVKSQQENFERIKKAYGIRSQIFHGQPLDKKSVSLEYLIELSVELDILLRHVLDKVIMQDSAWFLQKNDLLEKALNGLIFGNPLPPTIPD